MSLRHWPASRLLIAIALLIGLALSLRLAATEQLIAEAESRAQDVRSLRGAEPDDVAFVEEHDSRRLPPRALLAVGSIRSTMAVNEKKPAARRALIAEGRRDVDLALARRPGWGSAWVMRAYLDSLDPARGDATRAAFVRSYRAAPFLRSEGLWRVSHAVADWHALDPAIRVAALEEAQWLANRGYEDQDRVRAVLGGSAAAVAFQLRFRREWKGWTPGG